MKGKKLLVLTVLVVLVVASVAYAGEFKVYPGAVLDGNLTKEAQQMTAKANQPVEASVYVTEDPFEKVLAFYKTIGKEYVTPVRREEKLQSQASGKELMIAFVIFDGARGLTASKLWVKIQRPYVSQTMKEGPDKTYITVSDKR